MLGGGNTQVSKIEEVELGVMKGAGKVERRRTERGNEGLRESRMDGWNEWHS